MLTLKRHLVFFAIYQFFILSCAKNTSTDNNFADESLQLSAVLFEKDKNPSLSENLKLTADQDRFSGELPRYITKSLIPTFTTNAAKILIKNVEQQSGVNVVDFTRPVTYTLVGTDGSKKDYIISLNWRDFSIPHIYIKIDDEKDVVEKDKYLNAEISILGKDIYPDFLANTEIRGRGNSTWGLPKKPYRLRLKTKASVLGLPEARNWVLLANYLDASLMCNAVAMKIGRDLKVPFTNDIIPVDLTINGTYRGSYVLTQHLEVADNRINVTKNGYLFEFDTYFDEDFQFRSKNYNLPVMIKSPELENESEVEPIRNDFEQLEDLIFGQNFPNNGYRDKFDIDVASKFLLVNILVANEELNHPKSTYMHKVPGGKFTFGPLWDFDWGYGFEGAHDHFINPTRDFFWGGDGGIGTRFFKRLLTDPQLQNAFKLNWENYKTNHFASLMTFIDEYSAYIKDSKEKDEVLWKKGKNFNEQVVKMKNYLNNRKTYIDNYIKNGFK